MNEILLSTSKALPFKTRKMREDNQMLVITQLSQLLDLVT